MTDKDMHDWAEILAGRDVPDANSQTTREARMLRQVLLEAHAREAPVLDAGAKDRLLARLEQEGVIESLETASTPGRARVAARRPAAALTAVAALAAVLLLVLNPRVLVHTWLGEAPAPKAQTRSLALQLVIYAKSPEAQTQAVQDLQHKLSALSPRHHEVGTSQILEVYIGWPAPQAFVDVLHQYSLRLPPAQEESGLVRPWVHRVLQWSGLEQRPVQRVLIEVTHPAGG